MKKLLALSALLTLVALTGCSTTSTNTDTNNAVNTATNMGVNIFKAAVDMTNAALDPQYRTQLVTRVVAKSLQTCYVSFSQ